MNKDTYCVLPWKHLATHPHGGVTLCCVSDHANCMNRARNFRGENTELLDLNNNSVDEVMNSDYFKLVRLEMLNGIKPAACRRCYEQEASGVTSKRLEENHNFPFTAEEAAAITDEEGGILVDFKFIELRLGNLCNIKCRTCNPASSTQWRTEYSKLQEKLPFITRYDYKIDSSWTESEAFWNDLLEHSKSVEMIYINGGEPTLVEKHWGYLQRLIDEGLNKQVTLWYNINMTNLPDKLVELWKQFKEVRISASIDDLYQRNDRIRRGSHWEDVSANLEKLRSMPWIKTSVCQSVSIYNVWHLHEFYDYMTVQRGLHVHHNYVNDPAFLSAAIIKQEDKDVILGLCSNMDRHKLSALMHHFKTPYDAVKHQQFLDYEKALNGK